MYILEFLIVTTWGRSAMGTGGGAGGGGLGGCLPRCVPRTAPSKACPAEAEKPCLTLGPQNLPPFCPWLLRSYPWPLS